MGGAYGYDMQYGNMLSRVGVKNESKIQKKIET
jgi:hypothetical protein